MTGQVWTIRRNGPGRVGIVATTEPSLLERLNLPAVTWPDGQKWYELSARRDG